jgi:CBS domain containing-hemolysin-like protein
VLEAFLKMQEKKTPLSIVEDSEGKYVGIITIEDIIEEVVGDIDDKADYSKTSKILSNRPRINLKTDAKAKTDQ